MSLTACFCALALDAIAFSEISLGDPERFWFRIAGASHYLVFVALLQVVDCYRATPSVLSRTIKGVGVLAIAANLFVDWPGVTQASGMVDLVGVGPVYGGRMAGWAAISHIGYASIVTLLGVGTAIRLRSGRPELRVLLVLGAVGLPLYCTGVAAWAGWLKVPPPTGFLAALVAIFFSWHRLERHVHLTRVADKAQSIGGYRFLRRIGAGGMAEVFVAEKIGPHGFSRRVAVKRILPHLTAESHFVRMFVEEARLAARLEHPNIVQIHELGDEEGVYYIVMEHLDGLSLQQLGQRLSERGRPLAPGLVAQLGIQVLAALTYAHGLHDDAGRPLGIVHRDVTPQNIMVTRDGVVKLLDFGLAFAAGRERTEAQILKGKIAYTAPEYASGQGLDGRADLFAVGIVLYLLVAGRRPFDGASDAETMRNILDGTRPTLSSFAEHVPSALDAVISRALERDPNQRFQSAEEMATPLRRYLSEIGSRADGSALARLVRDEIDRPSAPSD